MEHGRSNLDSACLQLIYQFAADLKRNPLFSAYDKEDLVNELALRVIRALDKYDASLGTIRPYVRKVLRNTRLDLIRREMASRRGAGVRPLSLATPMMNRDGEVVELGDTLTDPETERRTRLRQDVRVDVSEQRPRLRQISEIFMSGDVKRKASRAGIHSRKLRSGRQALLDRFHDVDFDKE